MSLSKRIQSLEQNTLEADDEELGFELEPVSHREQLISALNQRRLGQAGQKLLAWLKHGGDLTPELEQLLRKACSKVPEDVFVKGKGLTKAGCLDPDRIIKELPHEVFEDAREEAARRFQNGHTPNHEDIELLRDQLTPLGLKEMEERLAGRPPVYPAIDWHGENKREWWA